MPELPESENIFDSQFSLAANKGFSTESHLSDEVIVSVVASSSMPIVTTALYVDGQEMQSSEDGTNFVINTCEWSNGSHVLFATAKSQSDLAGPSGCFNFNWAERFSLRECDFR
jgi:hypothetical protein